MILDIQYKIKNNPNYIRFIRENSTWYKILNRNPLEFKNFELEVKNKYKLNTSDKLNKMIEDIDMLQKFIEILK